MKKKVFLLTLMTSVVVAILATLKSSSNASKITSLFMEHGIEALAYSNEAPGGPNERHKQAVWCSSFWNGWKIAEGCCYGWETCYVIKCGVHGSFSCDGNNWISY